MHRWLKVTLIVLPVAAIFAEVLAWFLTKWDHVYAYVVVVGSGLFSASLLIRIVISLWLLWLLRSPSTIPAGSRPERA